MKYTTMHITHVLLGLFAFVGTVSLTAIEFHYLTFDHTVITYLIVGLIVAQNILIYQSSAYWNSKISMSVSPTGVVVDSSTVPQDKLTNQNLQK